MANSDYLLTNEWNKFQLLSNKLSSLVYVRTEGDKQRVNTLLDDFLSLNHSVLFVRNQDTAVLVINHCCCIVPVDDTKLVVKSCQLITELIETQHIKVTGKTLSIALSWCIENIKDKDKNKKLSVLLALEQLLKNNGNNLDVHFNKLLSEDNGILFDILRTENDNEIIVQILKCIEAIVTPSDEKLNEEWLEYCYKVCLNELKGCQITNELLHCKFLMSCIRSISNIFQQSQGILQNHISEILGIVKVNMLYGLPGHDNLKFEVVFPTCLSVSEAVASREYNVNKGIKGKYDKKLKKKNVSSFQDVKDSENNITTTTEENINALLPVWCKTSDSEFSDSENGQTSRLKSNESKVRQSAIIMLSLVVKTYNMKCFVGYINHFLPDGSIPQTRTLITCLLKEPSVSGRGEILAVLSNILQSGKQFFQQAEIGKVSFTSFSITLGNILKELHRCIGLALIAEKSPNLMTLILKCISDLVRCTPYYKLHTGILTKLSRHVKSYLKHKEMHVRCAALTVFGCIISIEKKTEEIDNIIKKPMIGMVADEQKPDEIEAEECNEDEFIEIEDDYEDCEEKPWILNICLSNVMPDNSAEEKTPVIVVIESLQVLSSLFKYYFLCLMNIFVSDLIQVLEYNINHEDYPIKLYTGKLMVTIMNSLQCSLANEDELAKVPISHVTKFWNSMLSRPLLNLVQSEEYVMLRATGCDCLSNLGLQVSTSCTPSSQSGLIYDQISREKQILCLTLLFGCTRDESAIVRSSAIRALAVFVLFPTLREDSLFLHDVIETINRSYKDENVGVRSQTAWLLGNLSEALNLNQKERIEDEITNETLSKLVEISIKLAEDSVKVTPSAVRAVGNLSKLIDNQNITFFKELLGKCVDCLIKNGNTSSLMKARWNSCYALSNVVQNELVQCNLEYLSKIFNSMLRLVQNCKNFKVRISACCVLHVINERTVYKDYFYEIWTCLLLSLENTQNVCDFNEYKHRDHLIDEICLTLSHLISLLQVDDIVHVYDQSVYYFDLLKQHMSRYQDRIVPEKCDQIIKASCNIDKLYQLKLTNEQRVAVDCFKQLFVRRW